MSDHLPEKGQSPNGHGGEHDGHLPALEPDDPIRNPGLPAHTWRPTDVDPAAEKRAERQVAGLFGLSAICAVLFVVAYFTLENGEVHDTVLGGFGPARRRVVLNEQQRERFLAGDAPLMVTEFGGISMSEEPGSWGYEVLTSPLEYAERLRGLFDALRASPDVVGFCYTQFMDTGQETNGLLFSDGTPKLPVATIRAIVTGREAGAEQAPTSTFGWTE